MTNTQSPAPGVAADLKAMQDEFEGRVRSNPANPKNCLAKNADDEYISPLIYAMWMEFIAGAKWKAGVTAFLQASAAAVPVAQIVIRNGRYEGSAPIGDVSLPDGTHKLYTAPPLAAQVQAAEGDVVQMLIAALDNIDATACCDHPMGMNDSRRRYAIARDARIAIARARAALASRTPAPGMAGGVEDRTHEKEILIKSVKEAIQTADKVGRSRGDNNYANNTPAVCRLVNLEASIVAQIEAFDAGRPAPAQQAAGADEMRKVVFDQDLYSLLTNLQNGIKTLTEEREANACIIRIDHARVAGRAGS